MNTLALNVSLSEKMKRFFVKYLGVGLLRHPPEEWQKDETKDYIMMFHYCHSYREYYYDRAYDHLSESACFYCGGCGERRLYRNTGFGILFFDIMEKIRIVQKIRKIKPGFARIKAYWHFFTRPYDYYPPHREGKTAGELEQEAQIHLCFSLPFILRHK